MAQSKRSPWNLAYLPIYTKYKPVVRSLESDLTNKQEKPVQPTVVVQKQTDGDATNFKKKKTSRNVQIVKENSEPNKISQNGGQSIYKELTNFLKDSKKNEKD